MRRALDEWATFVAALIMLLRLEDRLGTKFNDDEAYGVKSLRDLANIVAARLEQRDEAAPRSVELTTWAVGELAESPFWGSRPGRRLMAGTSPLDFDAPLLDVLDPGRWEGAPDSLRA